MEKKIIKFAIDEKSLFYGCVNDYERGETATVSTPLNQSKDKSKWRIDILDLIDTNARINNEEIPDRLIDLCQKNSKSNNIIQDMFVFDNIYLDGKKIDVECQFFMYIKKETDELIRDKHGKLVKNTHLGRLKLHYPISFSYKADGFCIDNKSVLNKILEINKRYAYIVRGFEYDIETRSLNFITSIIGPENALLSTVFRIGKGKGKKLRTDLDKISVDNMNLRNVKEDDDVVDNSFIERNKVSQHNGKKGEDFIFDLLKNQKCNPYHTSIDYPTSPYDIEYIDENGNKIYVEVKSTQSDRVFFRMSKYEYNFMEKYDKQYVLYMVLNVKDEFPKYKILKYEDIMRLRKEVFSYQFTKA